MSIEEELKLELEDIIKIPKPPIPKEYIEAGLTQVFDEKLGWIVVNADDLSKL